MAAELKAQAPKGQDKLPDSVKYKTAQAAGYARSTGVKVRGMWEQRATASVKQKTALYAQRAKNNRAVLIAASGAAVLWVAAHRRRS
ncbi:hypothetical protein ACGFSG_26295 [Streptomyces sp. NPDC048512]|uniref:hypothetical protein n=1 Tax=Streptomyces sp. NPDC048512 TaxID=3365563 RepID=UPI003712F888